MRNIFMIMVRNNKGWCSFVAEMHFAPSEEKAVEKMVNLRREYKVGKNELKCKGCKEITGKCYDPNGCCFDHRQGYTLTIERRIMTLFEFLLYKKVQKNSRR